MDCVRYSSEFIIILFFLRLPPRRSCTLRTRRLCVPFRFDFFSVHIFHRVGYLCNYVFQKVELLCVLDRFFPKNESID